MSDPKTGEPDVQFNNQHFVCDACGFEVFAFVPIPDDRRVCLECLFYERNGLPKPKAAEETADVR